MRLNNFVKSWFNPLWFCHSKVCLVSFNFWFYWLIAEKEPLQRHTVRQMLPCVRKARFVAGESGYKSRMHDSVFWFSQLPVTTNETATVFSFVITWQRAGTRRTEDLCTCRFLLCIVSMVFNPSLFCRSLFKDVPFCENEFSSNRTHRSP